MSGDVCHSYLRNKEAIELRGFGGAKTFASAEVCDVTVTTAYHARWMVHVQRAFIMDCRVKVAVYDTTIGDIRLQPVLEIGCASRDPGIIRLNTSVVTVRLHHRNASDYNFNIVLSARSTRTVCPWFLCASGDCVPQSLMCDGTDNCFDYSDEATNGTAHCSDYWPFKGENWGVLASVLGAGGVLGVTAFCCRHLRKRRDSFDELYDLNEGPYVHKYAYRYAVIRQPQRCNKNIHTRHDRDSDRGAVG
ncbi:hypothetical protein C0Q70_19325 [Pomacea canaliculata]|uniref:CUB domain-containing protein n=2 Tax=Pomacea canaliculata TaxID=400727 RepID=A0A2T7NJ28_POMCA|nr:hypothetical protein C0Q70_19325 [Pomacea canaliculata]